MYHPKHVEQFPDINKLCNVASCWTYSTTYYFIDSLRHDESACFTTNRAHFPFHTTSALQLLTFTTFITVITFYTLSNNFTACFVELKLSKPIYKR